MFKKITLFISAIITISSSTFLYGQGTNGLVAWWTFEEGSGTTTYDMSGNGHNGTLGGATWVSGGVQFTQNTQYVQFETTPFELSEGTWQVLINVQNFNNGWGYGSIVEKDYTGYNNDGRITVLDDGRIDFNIDDNSSQTTKSITSTNPISLNTDVEIVASWGLQGMKLYINNLLVGTNPHTGGITSSSSRPLTAGSHYTGTRSVLGVVKDLKVYNKYIFENIEGLVAHYTFNGDANDFSENGNNGTTNGGVTWGTDRFNNSGQAAEFNGIDGYIEVPNSVSLQSPISSISISAWININNWYPPLGIATILNKGGDGPEYWVYLYTEGLVIQLLGVGYFNVPYSFSLNRWYHIATTWDGNIVKIFIDDTIVYSEQITGSITPNESSLFIALDNPSVYEYLDGKLDDIRLYNRALTDAEISDLYNEGGWTASGELLAHYQFDGDYQDISGNNNNGNGFNTTFLDDRFNQTGKAVFFNGIDSYVSVPNSASISAPTQSISISLWFYLEQSFDIHNPFLTKSDDMGQNGQYSLNYCNCTDGNLIDLNIGNTANFIYHNFNLQQWYHLVVTYDGQQVRYYENGSLIGQTPFTGAIEVNSLPLEFGRNMPGLPDYYHGRLDDVRIYDGVLSQSEINELYHENGWTGGGSTNTIIITHGYTAHFVGWPIPIIPSPIDSTRWEHLRWQFAMADAVSENRDIYLIRKGKVYAIEASYQQLHDIDQNSTIEFVIDQYGVSRAINQDKDNVFIFDWTLEAAVNKLGYSEAAADVLAGILIELGRSNPFILKKLHFIGHSRGCVVNSEVIQRLIYWQEIGVLPSEITIDPEIHMTTLDAHPAGHWLDPGGFLVNMNDDDVNSKGIGIGVCGWKSTNSKVAFIDNYFESLFPIRGLSEFPGLSIYNPIANNDLSIKLLPNLDLHRLAHSWYFGTVDTLNDFDEFNDGPPIDRIKWYNSGLGTTQGFYYSTKRNGFLYEIESVESGLRDVNTDYSYTNSGYIFNGDFIKGDDALFERDSLPGWSYQDGATSKRGGIFNPAAEINDDHMTLAHNKIYIPTTAIRVVFRIQVLWPLLPRTNPDELEIYLDNTSVPVKTIVVSSLMLNYMWEEFLIPPEYLGKTCNLTFKLKKNQSFSSILLIDDVALWYNKKIRSTVACPVDFHIYDNLGNHTGPLTDSTYAEDIPGSEYYVYEDSTGDKIKTVYLEPLEGSDTYIFKIESRDTTASFNYEIEDYSDTTRGTITYKFDEVAIEPNTIATCNLDVSTQVPSLEVDLNGDGTIDTTYIPVVITAVENVENQELQFPKEYSLSQNYPNPFNPTTTIKYYIPNAVVVKLIIYDLLGREVKTLVNDFQQRGEHSIKFDGSCLSSGVYFYRLKAGDFMQTKKLILIK